MRDIIVEALIFHRRQPHRPLRYQLCLVRHNRLAGHPVNRQGQGIGLQWRPRHKRIVFRNGYHQTLRAVLLAALREFRRKYPP
jgi:hypothetical protein